jgi:glycosyltransferase involved in cell wall biosynthesis
LRRYKVEIGVTMDADNQHRPEDLPLLVRPILEDKLDLVIGSRILGERDKDSRVRLAGIILLTAIINFLTGLRLTDCSSGFKALRISKISVVNLYEEQFQAAEMLIAAAKAKLRVGEVPIHIKLRHHGMSKKGTNFSYGFFFAKTILKTWWR